MSIESIFLWLLQCRKTEIKAEKGAVFSKIKYFYKNMEKTIDNAKYLCYNSKLHYNRSVCAFLE